MSITISRPLCFTAQGQKPNQEDTLFPLKGEATDATHVFMVCDGMGGHENGEVASACVAGTIGSICEEQPLCSTSEMKETFEDALQQAYQRLNEMDDVETVKKMGTTLTFVAICTDGILVAHIGDSRVYQLRPGKGIVFQTRDHSLVNDLVAAGEITEEEAKTSSQRNIITRAIQPHQEYPAKASYNVLTDIRRGDLFFLCCDGVLEQLDNDDLCQMLLANTTLEKRLKAVETACLERKTRDNNTCYLIEIAEGNSTNVVEPTIAPTKGKYLVWIIASIVAVVVMLIFIFFMASSNSDPNQSTSTQQPVQVQGTIKRNKN